MERPRSTKQAGRPSFEYFEFPMPYVNLSSEAPFIPYPQAPMDPPTEGTT